MGAWPRRGDARYLVPLLFRFSTRHTAPHGSFARPLARFFFREVQWVLRRHVRSQSRGVVHFYAYPARRFSEFPFLAVRVLRTMVSLVLVHAFSCAQLATVQALCVSWRLFSRGLRHMFFRNVIIAHPWARLQVTLRASCGLSPSQSCQHEVCYPLRIPALELGEAYI